jgi:biotin-dependent carboxylase-like uncharacterized protein
MTAALRVISAGLHTTVQDLGRFGAQHLGIPVSGAMDSINLRLANLLAGNPDTAGALEMMAHGASFEVEAESARLAVAGPDARVDLIKCEHRNRVKGYESFTLKRGDQFSVIVGNDALVCYLAIEGGLAIAPVMGSQSTLVRAGLGGFHGRRLLDGDSLPLNRDQAEPHPELSLDQPQFPAERVVRVMLGPQDDYFAESMIGSFLSETFTISHQSDRMGFRLAGFTLKHSKGFDIVSDGTASGVIQVPGSGEPIILLADRGTTGGYPKIATVISADLPALCRLRPGETIRFKSVDYPAARQAADELNAWFSQVKRSMSDVMPQAKIDVDALFEQNIVDGVVSATDADMD